MKEASSVIADCGDTVKFTDNQLRRFWTKVEKRQKKECWIWLGAKDLDGYGFVRHRGIHCRAHRISWAIKHKKYAPNQLCVLHRCDNPSCVNPAHLFLGTHGDNAQDKSKKGRSVHLMGETNGMAKLTANDVVLMREEYRRGNISYARLGAKFGVKETGARFACLKLSWSHLE